MEQKLTNCRFDPSGHVSERKSAKDQTSWSKSSYSLAVRSDHRILISNRLQAAGRNNRIKLHSVGAMHQVLVSKMQEAGES